MMRIVSLIGAVLLLLGASVSVAVAQIGTPGPTIGRTLPALLQNTQGTTVAVALVAERDGEVSVGVVAEGLAPGAHGIHIHETGVCDPATVPPFSSAGGHYNPTGAEHGQHAGDLGNITAEADGSATFHETTTAFTLDELMDQDGSAIVIHAEEDEGDPAGESFGARIVCGVLAEPVAAAATEPVVTEAVATEPVATEVVATEPVATEAVATDAAVDTDQDGLVDDEEVNVTGTDPTVFDTDGDALGDGDEVNLHGTDPLTLDTDGDGVDDGTEVEAGTDPLDPASL